MSRKKSDPENLSHEDEALWQQVADSVTPLGERPKVDVPKRIKPVIRRRDNDHSIDERMVYGGFEGTGTGPGQTAFGKKEKRRIGRGTNEVDSSIDLHGLSREDAYRQLLRLIPAAHARGDRVVLVVTGKGGRKFAQSHDVPIAQRKREDFELDAGVLKAVMPGWLTGSDFNPYVAGFTAAHDKHGGDGALYVRLRRHKDGIKS